MKKTLIAVASLFIASPAFADTVNITSQASLNTPAVNASGTVYLAFTPTKEIVFNVAGKTCTWNSSAAPKYGSGAGLGCNYSITVDPSGNLRSPSSNGNGCTEAKVMLDQCITRK